MKSIYLTTTIPYVNAKPHAGFALELVQADFLARYYRRAGLPVRLQTGTDEHAVKNVEAARAQGIKPQEWVDAYAGHFRNLASGLDIGFDDFVRTTESRHHLAVRELISRLRPEDLEKRSYAGHYCKGCEDFWLERDAADGKCPEHRTPLTWVEEENIFFKLSRYQQQLEQLIEGDSLKILPVERKNEILGFVRRGLQDISISRDAARSEGWGVPFPGTTDQVVYVWIDALANYLVAPEWWSGETRKIHLLGKNVWKFHAIYWPALLLSAGLPLPDELIVHGFVTIDGNKISKSAGPTVDPADLIRHYGADPVRFYLLREIPSFTDGDFSRVRLEKCYADFLANGLGNLASRLLALAERSGLERITIGPKAVPEAAAAAIKEARYGNYLEVFWEQIRGLNREIDQGKPWEWLKSGDRERTRESCAGWLERLYQIAWWLEPAIPETSARLEGLLSAVPLRKGEVLFPRLEP